MGVSHGASNTKGGRGAREGKYFGHKLPRRNVIEHSFWFVLYSEVKGLDANRYATKKTVAQGMLDIALLTSNASQLKYVLQVGPKHEFYTLLVVLISISIVLQLLVGLLFVVIGGMDLNDLDEQPSAVILNDVIVIFIFVISVINIVISAFGIEYSNSPLVLERLKYINSEYLRVGNVTGS